MKSTSALNEQWSRTESRLMAWISMFKITVLQTGRAISSSTVLYVEQEMLCWRTIKYFTWWDRRMSLMKSNQREEVWKTRPRRKPSPRFTWPDCSLWRWIRLNICLYIWTFHSHLGMSLIGNGWGELESNVLCLCYRAHCSSLWMISSAVCCVRGLWFLLQSSISLTSWMNKH